MAVSGLTVAWFGTAVALAVGVPLGQLAVSIAKWMKGDDKIHRAPVVDLLFHGAWGAIVLGAFSASVAGRWAIVAGVGGSVLVVFRLISGASLASLPPSERKGSKHPGYENWWRLLLALAWSAALVVGLAHWGSPSVPSLSMGVLKALIVVAWGVFAIFFGGRFVGAVLDALGHHIARAGGPKGEEDAKMFHEEESIGRLVGYMERLVLFSFTIFGASSAAAIVIAVKAFVQFPELKSPRFTAFYIIGTLWSVFIGVSLGLLVQKGWFPLAEP